MDRIFSRVTLVGPGDLNEKMSFSISDDLASSAVFAPSLIVMELELLLLNYASLHTQHCLFTEYEIDLHIIVMPPELNSSYIA